MDAEAKWGMEMSKELAKPGDLVRCIDTYNGGLPLAAYPVFRVFVTVERGRSWAGGFSGQSDIDAHDSYVVHPCDEHGLMIVSPPNWYPFAFNATRFEIVAREELIK